MKENLTGFSNEWESTYSLEGHLSIWPWSDVVSYVNRYLQPKSDFTALLELGCGAGANIPFFLSRGDDYCTIEGSQTIVEKLKSKFPSIAKKIFCGDFTKDMPFDQSFDVILDRGSLTHNNTESIERCLRLLSKKIRKGGVFIGIDWFSTKHPDSNSGIKIDQNTRKNIASRQFSGIGAVHFSDKAHIEYLFNNAGFDIKVLEHKESIMLTGTEMINTSSINFVAVKRGL